MNIQEFLFQNRISGRKANRWLVTLILAAIGAAIVVAFWRWAFGAPFPPIPAEGIVVAALPYIQSMWDNAIRTFQRRQEIAVAPRSI